MKNDGDAGYDGGDDDDDGDDDDGGDDMMMVVMTKWWCIIPRSALHRRTPNSPNPSFRH
jgi:hypothetical protein